jgi:agmatine deiminase
MEGGAIDVNGRGTLLTTAECLLNPNRNPALTRADIEQYLADHLGVVNILWLDGHVAGDDTDGHVDELARFVNPTTVVTALEEDPADENFRSLQESYKYLKTLRDQDGRRLEVVPLPMPRARYVNDQRLPACYANFYIANGVVIVPQFGDPADQQAVEILARLLPDRQVRGLYATDLVWGLGAYHCITQQEPAL